MTRQRSISPQPDSARKRGRIACTACRQAKARCDFVTIPCSRCAKLGIDCSIDYSFKRTNKRDKVNELEDNIHRLQSIVEQQQQQQQQRAGSSINSHVDPETSTRSPVDVAENQSSNAGARGLDVPSEDLLIIQHDDPRPGLSGSRTLGSVVISNSEIDRLFAIYFEQFHPFLPILNPEHTPSDYYQKSTPLFWSIIAVALRSHKNSPLLMSLTPALSAHLWTEIGTANKSQVGRGASDTTEIQSLLLLATWPLPGMRLWSDRSLLMSNMALTSAMHIGLHRPGFDVEYTREHTDINQGATIERSSIWVTSYSMCISGALENGHVPLVPTTDWLINTICSHTPKIQVPSELRHLAIIQRQVNDAFQTLAQMSENPAEVSQTPSFYPHLAAFEKILTEIEAMYSSEMSLVNKMRSRGNLLLLQAMYFLGDHSCLETKQGILRAHSTAASLLTTLIDESDISDYLAVAPYILLRIILRAAFTMLKVFFSSYGEGLDRAHGKLLINTTSLLLRSMSVQPKDKENDQPSRVAEALKRMWNHMEKDTSLLTRPPIINVRSRFGASMGYDCLLYYREAVKNAVGKVKKGRGQQRKGPPLTPASIESSLDQVSVENLNLPVTDLTTPFFEEFMESDLEWMDSLVYPGLFSGL